MTVETVAPMDRAEAQRVTERIRLKLDSAANVLDSLGALAADAYQRRADLALGYGSWAEYTAAEFAAQTANLAAPIRHELVGRLTEAGMSNRAIAAVAGVSEGTVRNDRRQVRNDYAPDPLAEEKAEGRVVKLTGPGSLLHSEPIERIDMETGEVLTEPRTVTGLDGKTYTRPEPTTPRRRALTDQAQDAAVNLTAAIERVVRIFADDRYPQNREQVASVTRSHLLRTAKVCQDLASQLPN